MDIIILASIEVFYDTVVYHLAHLSKIFIGEEKLLLGGKPRCLVFSILQCPPFVRLVYFYSLPRPSPKGISKKLLSKLPRHTFQGVCKGHTLKLKQKRESEWNTSFLVFECSR